MNQDFVLPAGFTGRFAIVKLWPGIKTAEDECIARLKKAASMLGLECLEVDANGYLLEDPVQEVSKKTFDFVLHLHYDTPKLYDAYSLVALWNPVQFYHEWGYARTSRNLLTHDDFVSCSSTAADDHVSRLTRNLATHLPPCFNLYHSLADIVHLPSLGDQKLFYAGINWDALRGGVSRHQELLKRLDGTGRLRIYGPKHFQGVEVWKGYQSYVREIPFDGVSMLNEINQAGVALVLSSQAHKDSELMSNRLFESVAAGALVICDENNFAKKFFGDALLYIDSRCDVDEIYRDIETHLDWVTQYPDQALAMIAKAQALFKERFALTKSLSDLYNGFADRKRQLINRQIPEHVSKPKIGLYLLLPDYSEDAIKKHITSASVQEYDSFSSFLVIDKSQAYEHRPSIEALLADSSKVISVLEIDFYSFGIGKKIKARQKMGQCITQILALTGHVDALVFVAPNEKIFSNHLLVLAGSLMRNPDAMCTSTAMILKRKDQPIHAVHETIDFRELQPGHGFAIGYARFAFRTDGLSEDLKLALPYLDRKPMAVLMGNNIPIQEAPATVIVDLEHEFPSGKWNEGCENTVIAEYSRSAFSIYTGCQIILPPLASYDLAATGKTIKRLSREWFGIQITLLRKYGLMERLKELKRKLTRDV
ncbi:MAG: hypothetical protein CTY29_02450 [Methylobacter sp.]|nr:MAG: hypothetical protein CTY29_02450 [Methylobacter sp.]